MFRLARTVRFCVNPEPGNQPSEPDNSFAGYPSMRGLGRYYEIEVACAGEIDPLTGYFLNIKDIDRAVRTVVVPEIAAACEKMPKADPSGIFRSIIERLNASLRGTVASVRWRLTPYYSIEMSPNRPETVLIRQQFDFAASHRLHAPTLSDAGNRAKFGKCNNPGGHGHNYRVEPCVEVRMGPAGASPFGLGELEHITARTIIDRFDHKNLNQDTSDFGGDTGRNPSVENIAKVCFELLGPAVSSVCSEARLKCITVWETDKTSCMYPG